MGIRFIQCTTTAQADELLDAGLLWVNQDSSQERMFPEWQIAHQHHRMAREGRDPEACGHAWRHGAV